MVYQEKFVVVVKVRGKILREHDGIVTIPFGEEYSILLKNLHSVKAAVTISIDGQDVLNGNQIIINPNDSTELEGYMRGVSVSNKFKFIHKTKEIQDYRGDKIDDGMIRVEYTFEKIIEKREVIVEEKRYLNCNYNNCNKCCDYWNCLIRRRPWCNTNPWLDLYGTTAAIGSNIKYTSHNLSNNISNTSQNLSMINQNVSVFNCSIPDSLPLQDEGITVKGSESNQIFNYGNIGILENNSHVIVLILKGTTSYGEVVKEPVLVDKKIKCKTCGKISKSSSKYCRNCGTSLI